MSSNTGTVQLDLKEYHQLINCRDTLAAMESNETYCVEVLLTPWSQSKDGARYIVLNANEKSKIDDAIKSMGRDYEDMVSVAEHRYLDRLNEQKRKQEELKISYLEKIDKLNEERTRLRGALRFYKMLAWVSAIVLTITLLSLLRSAGVGL